MTSLLIQLIQSLAQLLILIVVIDAILSFFLPPYHSARMLLGRIVDPLLAPIRRYVPPIGMFDISPIILIVLIEVITRILVSLLLQ